MTSSCSKIGTLALYLFLGGCAYIHSLDDNLPRQIDVWIENKDYGKALDTLYYIQPGNDNYQHLMRQKERIINLASTFETDIVNRGKEQLNNKNWHQAYEVYEYGLDKIPDSRIIQKARAEFLTKRAVYLKQLKLKLLQNKTKWLISDAETRKEIARVIPKNYSAHWLLQDHKLDIDSTSQTLIECVNESIGMHELDVARQCLNIANQLNPSPAMQQGILDAGQRLEQEIEVRSRKISPVGKKILRTAKLSVAKGDFHSAHQELLSLPEQDKKNGQILAFREELDELTYDYVDKSILEGRKLYSAGKVQEAYLLWKSLKPIAADNDRLQTLIDRAEKILLKLHKIGSSQEVVTPPGQ